MKIKKFNEHLTSSDKLIRTTYQTTTPESLENGDYEDQGWVDEEGESMRPDEYDVEEGITAVDNAVEFLKNNKYTTEPSSTEFMVGTSYSSSSPYEENYQTDEKTYYTCHLDGFTEEEELRIYSKITNKKQKILSDLDKYNL